MKSKAPLYAPNQKSTYSNVNFNLLGLVIENATSVSYTDYIKKSIFEPLHMKRTTLDTPRESDSVIPRGENDWGVELGVQRPTGGIYSSTSDMSRYLRYILTHYNGLTHAVNWFQPASYSDNFGSFYGMPWEIFRTDKILRTTQRPVTFVTKSGGLAGYYSIIIMVPEYNLGITILVAGSSKALSQVRELVTIPLLRAADGLAFKQVDREYRGEYSKSLQPNSKRSTNIISRDQLKPQLFSRSVSKFRVRASS